ncbi:hypothetical protein [Streptosporangium amethystogenes]|uniref:hypothetical protein n=1 Tax=Streptosporangium amethystogenes TaxID=2002 RepID=UPI0004C49EA0|nr:hypothetical protein [Streptosporangium amethystogenes]
MSAARTAPYAFLKFATGPDPAEGKPTVYWEGWLERFDGLVGCGIPSRGYRSGTSLGDGAFFGRRAGRSAAAA